jgi:hypothetical protein
MITQEQVKKAIAAHGAWKSRLKKAVETGRSEFSGTQVGLDNLCEFGKWLYSLPAADQENHFWKEVRTTHAEFHREAGRILALALKGSKTEALAALEFRSPYVQLTGKLMLLLTRWSRSLS